LSTLNVIADVQRTEEWFAARLGCLTGSRIAAAMSKAKRENLVELQVRHNLKMELAVERITGKPAGHYVSRWMERGVEMEPLARGAYTLRHADVTETGFVLHPRINWAGCSPDGLVGDDGLIEIKVPKPTTHAEYIIGETVPAEYLPQMMWQMAVTGRKWNDFVSYCPDFPEPLDLFICRLERDEKQIAAMEAEAVKFLAEVEAMVTRLKGGLEGALRASLGERNDAEGIQTR
jgi:putative phage-type endonuclease